MNDYHIEGSVPRKNVRTGQNRVEWPVIGGRCRRDLVKVIDRAAVENDQTRGEFLVQAAVEKAQRLLAKRATVQSAAAS